MPQSPPVVLTIAGFDPSSGAGISADIKTIAAHGCYGVAAITSMTVQSTGGVRRVSAVDPHLLAESLEELTNDIKVSAVHVGMLGTGESAATVVEFLHKAQPATIVLDPVLKSSSGATLLDRAGMEILVQQLLPLADVITPNVDEAAALTGAEVSNSEQMKNAAQKLHEMGAKAVVVTGGHLDHAIDVLSLKDDYIQIFRADRLESPNTHGTGCAFSTAITCQLALGRSLPAAVLLAKAYITAAINSSYSIGKGAGPVNHMYQLRNHPRTLGIAKNFATGKG
jgi:hydroxymethylpyrimidine/phosphomethylpyrimidine kinase